MPRDFLRDDVGIVPYGFYPTSVQHRRGGCPHPPVCEGNSLRLFAYGENPPSLAAKRPPFVCFADISPA